MRRMFKNYKRWAILIIFCLILAGLYLNSTAWFRMKSADYYMQTKHYDKAITLYKKIWRKETFNAKHKTLTIKRLTEIYPALVNLLLIENRFFETAQVLKEMAVINPAYKISSFPELSDSKDYKKFGLWLLKVDLEDIALKQFQRAAELQPDNPLGYYQLGLIYQKQGMQEGAIAQYKKAIELSGKLISQPIDNLPDYLGDAYYNLALKFERDGNIEDAKAYYEKTIELDGNRIIEAFYRLKSLYKKQGKFEDVESVETGLLNLKPEYEVNYKVSGNLILLGYSMNEREFELFDKGKITFFWEVSAQNSGLSYEKEKLSDIYKIGSRLYEIKEVENLAPNFGFEAEHIDKGFPFGWEADIYCAPLENHEIVSESLPLGENQYLMLNNTTARRVNCRTNYIPVNEDNLYLQAGWVKSINGNAYLGRKWFDSKENVMGYNHVVSGKKFTSWEYYSQVVIPPPNSAYCRLWTINYDTQGKACFDNVVFLKLQLPRDRSIVAGGHEVPGTQGRREESAEQIWQIY